MKFEFDRNAERTIQPQEARRTARKLARETELTSNG